MLTDRTIGIRASVRDVEIELMLAVVLVVLVIFLFLRSLRATVDREPRGADLARSARSARCTCSATASTISR